MKRRQYLKQLKKLITWTNRGAFGFVHESLLKSIPGRYREIFKMQGLLFRYEDFYAMHPDNLLFLKDICRHTDDLTINDARKAMLQNTRRYEPVVKRRNGPR